MYVDTQSICNKQYSRHVHLSVVYVHVFACVDMHSCLFTYVCAYVCSYLTFCQVISK